MIDGNLAMAYRLESEPSPEWEREQDLELAIKLANSDPDSWRSGHDGSISAYGDVGALIYETPRIVRLLIKERDEWKTKVQAEVKIMEDVNDLALKIATNHNSTKKIYRVWLKVAPCDHHDRSVIDYGYFTEPELALARKLEIREELLKQGWTDAGSFGDQSLDYSLRIEEMELNKKIEEETIIYT